MRPDACPRFIAYRLQTNSTESMRLLASTGRGRAEWLKIYLEMERMAEDQYGCGEDSADPEEAGVDDEKEVVAIFGGEDAKLKRM